ncbi:MAG: hypothetical protein IT209_06220 [Armatimonadetes bacterium]|nr:hypothetical protein [Armatimonadota bacterium]
MSTKRIPAPGLTGEGPDPADQAIPEGAKDAGAAEARDDPANGSLVIAQTQPSSIRTTDAPGATGRAKERTERLRAGQLLITLSPHRLRSPSPGRNRRRAVEVLEALARRGRVAAAQQDPALTAGKGLRANTALTNEAPSKSLPVSAGSLAKDRRLPRDLRGVGDRHELRRRQRRGRQSQSHPTKTNRKQGRTK